MDDRVKCLRRTPALLIALACGCSSTYSPPASTARVIVTTDKTTLLNDGVATANITAICTDAAGKAGTGSVNFTAPFGSLASTGVAPGASIGVGLDATGTAKATFTCGVGSDPRCSGGAGVIVTVSWSGSTGTAAMTVQAPVPTDGGGGGGPPPPPPGTDGGVASLTSIALVSVFPAYVIVSGAANAGQNLPGTATATFSVTSGGLPASGASVNFAEAQGESLVTLGATSGTTDAYGNVTVTLTGKAVQGLAHITAWITGSQVTMTLPVLGGPTSIMATAFTPSVLGLKGSGIQETGLMTFTITDSLGSPIPGVTVNFTQGQPNLVTLGHPAVTTDAMGHAVVDYSAGPEVGVSSIIATVAATNATASHAIAVRGAKPSASGFNFHCAKANLPVYTTTSYFERTECTVRLSDRYGNRVGIPTPVSFAAEAGSISASAVTKAFDYNNPTDPDEGSVTVTFSSDMGNGFSPMDVAPLAAAPTQYPIPRVNPEPSRTNGQLVFNPRDQLVTLIAMVRGEEAFIDSNHNGLFDPGEIFVDQGDPYIDSNDNNVYDPATEVRFCGGASCATYNAPNNTWDSDRTIWAPTWVVFTDVPSAIIDPYSPTSCADYSNNDNAGAATVIASAKMLDLWLNPGAAGTSYSALLFAPQPGLSIATNGGFPELDNWGAAGLLHFNFDWVRVSAADNTKACGAVGTVCVERLVFGDFDVGYRITAYVTNANKVPVPPTNGHACGATPTAGTHSSFFSVDFTASTGSVKSNVTAAGTYGY